MRLVLGSAVAAIVTIELLLLAAPSLRWLVWLLGLFAALLAASAGFSAGRVVRARAANAANTGPRENVLSTGLRLTQPRSSNVRRIAWAVA